MKKIAVALMCTILATGAAMAQKQFTFGPKVGVDFTNYWGEGCPHGGQLNYQAGLFMEYRFTDKFSVAPEVVFAAQGGKYKKDLNYDKDGLSFSFNGSFTDHVNYINVPVMLKYYITPSLSIDFGPQIGFNVYSKCSSKNSLKLMGVELLNPEGKEIPADQKDYTKTVDVGVGLGLTYNIAKDVFVQCRYTMGMTNVFKDDIDKTNKSLLEKVDNEIAKNLLNNILPHNSKAKNGNAQIAIGYRF